MTSEGERPAFELPDTDGRSRSLPEPGEATATVVVWTCNHCPYALAWHDRIVDVASDYADREVRFFAVNSNDAEGWPFPYLWDETQVAAREWGARVTPHLFVLDAELRLRYEGAADGDHQDPGRRAEWLRAALEALLGGGDPPASTEAVGCSIKWRP